MDRLIDKLHSSNHVRGLTHNFYRYPACMSPELAREIIAQFSQTGDFVLDPFMGGGTSVIEAIVSGRKAIGIDLNPIAVSVTSAKSTPLSLSDQKIIRDWAYNLKSSNQGIDPLIVEDEPRVLNLPYSIASFLGYLTKEVSNLPQPRQRLFTRCLLLRIGKWAVETRRNLPTEDQLEEKLLEFLEEMFNGLGEFVEAARSSGISKNKITGRRVILAGSAIDINQHPHIAKLQQRPNLVLTSPPYPGVHVLYHRWQVNGRRETPAPYWLINENDGHGSSYYTLGSRTPTGLNNYFYSIMRAFQSIKEVISPDTLVVQLVSFSDIQVQLPVYLDAMERAGYFEDIPNSVSRTKLWRSVPNRRWYNQLDTARDKTYELLLFHRPYKR